MTAVIIIGIGIYLIYINFSKKNTKHQITQYKNPNEKVKPETNSKHNVVRDISKNIKVTVTTSNTLNTNYDDSILDISNLSCKINLTSNLKKNSYSVPYWAHVMSIPSRR